MKNLIRDLVLDADLYTHWFSTATETQQNMLWEELWNTAAKHHSDNEFIQGLYEFYQLRGYLTHKQFYFLINTLNPSILKTKSLRDRLND